jgi:hypothetical protein
MGGSQAHKERFKGVTSLNNSKTCEDFLTPPILDHHETAILDSWLTGHFLLSNAPCRYTIKSLNPLRFRLPNGETMDSLHAASLDIPELSNFFPEMANNYLLSVLCNEGFYVTFRIDGVKIYNYASKVILKGHWYPGLGNRIVAHQLALWQASA